MALIEIENLTFAYPAAEGEESVGGAADAVGGAGAAAGAGAAGAVGSTGAAAGGESDAAAGGESDAAAGGESDAAAGGESDAAVFAQTGGAGDAGAGVQFPSFGGIRSARKTSQWLVFSGGWAKPPGRARSAGVVLSAADTTSFQNTSIRAHARREAVAGVTLNVQRGEFLVLCGASGCGKTTLLRHLKTALTPFGERRGTLRYKGRPLEEVPLLEQASALGYVLQNPDNQIVTDKVWHELAFGLENLGYEQQVIRLRTAEMASFFGIQTWYHKKVIELSGGQKQLLNLAAVMALQPEVLICDEPTSQLDPIAAAEFLAAVKKVNGELGTTVLLSEHRLEDALPLADRVVVMAEGRIVAEGRAGEIGRQLAATNDPMLTAMPTPLRVALALEEDAGNGVGAGTVPDAQLEVGTETLPVSVREGRRWLEGRLEGGIADWQVPHSPPSEGCPAGAGWSMNVQAQTKETTSLHKDEPPRRFAPPLRGRGMSVPASSAPAKDFSTPTPTTPVAPASAPVKDFSNAPLVIAARELWFRYERTGTDILRGLTLNVREGEFLAIVGGNGTGKSTALGVLSGRLKAYRGTVEVAGLNPAKASASALCARGFAALPQDPQTLFVHNTILEDLLSVVPRSLSPEERQARLASVVATTEIGALLQRHPYDVSGGEQQRAALAIALLTEPRILLLDEPTKGMDAFYKQRFARVLATLRAQGLTIVMVSHDVEFCAAWVDRCALFFDGAIVSEDTPRRFFCGNSFYTTAANRMSRGLVENVAVADELVEALRSWR